MEQQHSYNAHLQQQQQQQQATQMHRLLAAASDPHRNYYSQFGLNLSDSTRV